MAPHKEGNLHMKWLAYFREVGNLFKLDHLYQLSWLVHEKNTCS